MIAGAGTEFTLLGDEHPGLYVEDEDNYYSCIRQPSSPYLTSYYVEDEDNVGSVRKRGSQYNDDVNLYTRSNGVTCYTTSSVTVTPIGSPYPNPLYYKSGDSYVGPLSVKLYYAGSEKTYYTRSNGATRYTTSLVDTPLYEDGGTHTYTLYKKVSKNLYESGSTVTYPAYKQYSGKAYDAGQRAVISPAEVTTENVTALTV